VAFDRLHPALQYHIVNTLGWPGLREVQEQCIEPILSGHNLIIQAQTAGGKTEASFFPLLSRMLQEDWRPISVLYISPLRALLNNQEQRLRKYFEMVGHNAAVWHGDTSPGERKRIRRELPSCLLTTPESIEAMLVSRSISSIGMFGNLRAVVIDEVHAFAGDDRGWHLQALLARLTHLIGRPIQRIGLSATVGNPEEMADWLNAGRDIPHPVVRPAMKSDVRPDVQLDFVGSLDNAAKVIATLHRGEKRLVFTDSRSRCEDLGARLRDRGIRTFVTHSSLSKDIRKQTEQAFAEEKDCVVVATSALELGIDIGDLDRVIQIDAPNTVSSFLQRMGRSGRRSDTTPNCLFLATDEETLLSAAALIHLWENGYVEPVIPPTLPVHVLAQQIMALMLQERGIAPHRIVEWLDASPGLSALAKSHGGEIVEHMVAAGIAAENDGMLWFAERGEALFGKKHFLEILSVFTTPALMEVLHGRTQIATLDQLTFFIDNEKAIHDGRPTLLTLAGRSWVVEAVDYRHRQIHVVPTQERGKTRWQGVGRDQSFHWAQAHQAILCGTETSLRWSRRANEGIERQREQFQWLPSKGFSLRRVASQNEIWTFAGSRFNRILLQELGILEHSGSSDALHVRWVGAESMVETAESVRKATRQVQHGALYSIPPNMKSFIKFSEAAPEAAIYHMLTKRLVPEREAVAENWDLTIANE
jgi:ATP-dependent helicase Lhr and Lhr-like helicase